MNHDSVTQRNPGKAQRIFPPRDNRAASQGESPDPGKKVERVNKTPQSIGFRKLWG